ncbi:MAG TPA: amino acid permease [Candidatus Obscuribacterales bacterium]
MFVRKKVEDLHEDLESGPKLKRCLGPMGLISLGIGGIIGAGIFSLTGTVASKHAGPAILISFVLAGIICAFAGLCYAEFAAMIPIAGSAYTYAYATMGELLAWIIGWDLILEYLFGASTVAVSWSGYLVSFLKPLGIVIPTYLASAPLDHVADKGWILTGAILNLPAMFIIGLLTVMLVIGTKESSNFNNVIVVVKLIILFLFVGVGIAYINQANWHPFIPPNQGVFGEFGWSGVMRGAGMIFFAYIGFDAVSTAAQEAKNPQRDMPIGILGSLIVSTVVYILVALVLTGIVSYKLLNVPDPIAVGIDATGLVWLGQIIKIGALAGLSSVILISLLGQPRIFFSMSRDGLLPPAFSKVHPKYGTPYIPTIITGVVAMIVAGLFPIGILGELVSIGTLLAFAIVCLGVLFLRYIRPDLERPFRTPWSPVIPLLGAGGSFWAMSFLPLDTWIRLLVWMAIGMAIYFGYGIKHSKVRLKMNGN